MPREFMERGKASPKVDIYSFGLIILEMVTGKPRGSWSNSPDAPSLYGEGLIKQVINFIVYVQKKAWIFV